MLLIKGGPEFCVRILICTFFFTYILCVYVIREDSDELYIISTEPLWQTIGRDKQSFRVKILNNFLSINLNINFIWGVQN